MSEIPEECSRNDGQIPLDFQEDGILNGRLWAQRLFCISAGKGIGFSMFCILVLSQRAGRHSRKKLCMGGQVPKGFPSQTLPFCVGGLVSNDCSAFVLERVSFPAVSAFPCHPRELIGTPGLNSAWEDRHPRTFLHFCLKGYCFLHFLHVYVLPESCSAL